MLSIRGFVALFMAVTGVVAGYAQQVVGYSATTGSVIFEFDLRRFWVATSANDGHPVNICNIQISQVYASGSFCDWKPEESAFHLKPMEGQPLLYTLMVPKEKLGKDGDTATFKFALRGTAITEGGKKKEEGIWWVEPSRTALNVTEDGDGNRNLFLKIGKTQSPVPPASASVARTATVPVRPEGGYLLHGQLKGVSEQIVYLRAMYGSRTVVDSVVADNGIFVFTGTAKEPDIFEIVVGEYMGSLPVVIENEHIDIKGSLTNLDKVVVKGGKEHHLYQEHLQKMVAGFGKQQQAILKSYHKAEAANDTVQMAALGHQYDSLDNALSLAALKASYTQPLKGHVAGLVALYVYARDQPIEARFAAIDSLPEAQRSHRLGVTMLSRWEKERAVTVGKAAPAFSQNDTSGNPVSLASFKGKYVLIDFWASWCGPCRAENPNVVAAYTQYHPKGFEILGVSLDTKREAWIKAIHADSLTWSHVSDLKGWQNAVGQTYSVRSIPQNFLLDKEGNIIAIGLRGEELKAKLAELMP